MVQDFSISLLLVKMHTPSTVQGHLWERRHQIQPAPFGCGDLLSTEFPFLCMQPCVAARCSYLEQFVALDARRLRSGPARIVLV